MLSSGERVVVEALLPSGGGAGIPLGALDSGFESFHEEFERAAPPAMRWGLKAAFLAAFWLSPLLIRRLPPLGRLCPTERERALEAMGRSRLYLVRQLFLLLKTALCLHFGAEPRVRAALGWPR